ncbi:unnamed protein product, partial [Rhizoctonia solani]
SNYWKIYNRATKSMRSHPRRLEHPRDCLEVRNVGPKIQKLLIERHEAQVGKTDLKSTTAPRMPSGSSANPPAPSVGLDSDSDREPSTTIPLRAEKSQSIQLTSKRSNHTQRALGRPRMSKAISAPAATSDLEPENDAQPESTTETNVSEFPTFEPIIFPAGSYYIQLVLDEREVKSVRNRDYMLEHLKGRGVNAIKRSLEIGDVCWIARPNDDSLGECVLDYILERKRMDDLKGSILDGRFHEQKFRLRHTGISHIYYLVEDFDTERIARHWRDQINTALSSTQVIDRFFLKETTSIEDTLDYLYNLHTTILKIYADKPLRMIPLHLVKRYNFLALKQHLKVVDPDNTYHTTYTSYQELNRKNGFYTLQDCMARMLQCVRGLSEEKIAALLEHYPTPRSLYQAFVDSERHQSTQLSSAGSEKGKGKHKTTSSPPALMLSELGGRGRNKIGPALSKHIYEIFMDSEYEV